MSKIWLEVKYNLVGSEVKNFKVCMRHSFVLKITIS